MKLKIELTEDDFRNAIKAYVEEAFGFTIDAEVKLTIETKSKQNYKSEWETAAYRAYIEADK